MRMLFGVQIPRGVGETIKEAFFSFDFLYIEGLGHEKISYQAGNTGDGTILSYI